MAQPLELPDFDLTGRVALLTGAGRGIGLGIARALAAAGAAVVIQDIELGVAQAEAQRTGAAGGRALALGGDATQLADFSGWVQQTVERAGGLHILVNNAAVQKMHHTFAEHTPEEFERQFRANQLCPFVLCQQALPILRRQRWGRILNLGSINVRGTSVLAPYAMTKAAIENLTLTVARMAAGDGVTCNCIHPGFFDTHRNAMSEERKREEGQKIVPTGRMGVPDDIAGLALTLASDAGSQITGQTIYVDGGMKLGKSRET